MSVTDTKEQREFLDIQSKLLGKMGATEKVLKRIAKLTKHRESFEADILSDVDNQLDKQIKVASNWNDVAKMLKETALEQGESTALADEMLQTSKFLADSYEKVGNRIDDMVSHIPFISDEMKKAAGDSLKNFFAPMIDKWSGFMQKGMEA
jgi:hypothetical protein